VLGQGYPNLEYVIIDGGSTDESVSIIKKYENQLAFWISEKDNGQADAINKGFKHCTGEIFNFINSDDYLADNALQTVAKAFCETDAGAVAGTVQNFDSNGLLEKYQNDHLSPSEFFADDPIYVYHQPGVWMRTDFMKQVGIFRIDFHYCFDQEYMLRYLLSNPKVLYLPETLAFFRVHENSKSVAKASNFFWDFNRIYKEFWKKNRGNPLAVRAKEKQKKFEWPLMQEAIGLRYKNRLLAALFALGLIVRDPIYRLTKSNLGWVKHILFGKTW